MSAHTDTQPPDLTRAEAQELLRRLSDHATQRRRTRRVARSAAASGAVVVLGAAMAWALASLSGLGADRTRGSGGTEEAPNYRFEDVRVVHPYVEPETEQRDPDRAGVEFAVYWTSGRYVGEHECTITVYGPDGAVVGSLDTRFASLSEGHWRHPIAVDVSGSATFATIYCDPTRLDTPVAFVVTDTNIEPLKEEGQIGGIRYSYTVNAPKDLEPPAFVGTNACTLSILDAQGRTVAGGGSFTLTTGTPNDIEAEWRSEEFASMTPAEIGALTLAVECEPFTGAPDQTG